MTENEILEIQKQVVDVCKLVYDPEIPVNIYDLGLIYDIDVQDGGHVHIKMTLTAPSCPEGDFLMEDLRMKVEGLREVSSCEVELTFEGDRIVVARPLNMLQFAWRNRDKNHDLKTFLFHDGQKVCTRILADFTDKAVCIENYTDNLIKTAFGKNTMPTWDDFMSFLEERCVPRARAELREYLEALGLDEYDPLEIILRTHGRMAEDDQWIEVL